MLKAFLGIEAVLAVGLAVYGGVVAAAFLASTVADNWVPVLAVIGAVTTSAISPVVMSNLNNRAAERRAAQAADIADRAQKRDWARQDEVATRVEEVGKRVDTTAEALATSNKEVAEKVTEAASLAAMAAETLVVSNEVVATKVSEVRDSAILVAEKVSAVADTAASSAASTEAKLEEIASGQHEIHALANSSYTASLNAQLAALRATGVALTTLADLQEAGDKPVFLETRQQVEDVAKAAKLLDAEIQDRLMATEQAQKAR